MLQISFVSWDPGENAAWTEWWAVSTTRAIIGYVKRHHPELLTTLFTDLDPFFDSIDNIDEFLSDEHNWISQQVCAELFKRVRLHSDNPEVAREIGRESIIYRRLGYIESIFIKAIGHPYLSVMRAPGINAKFNKTKIVEIAESDWGHAGVGCEVPGARLQHGYFVSIISEFTKPSPRSGICRWGKSPSTSAGSAATTAASSRSSGPRSRSSRSYSGCSTAGVRYCGTLWSNSNAKKNSW